MLIESRFTLSTSALLSCTSTQSVSLSHEVDPDDDYYGDRDPLIEGINLPLNELNEFEDDDFGRSKETGFLDELDDDYYDEEEEETEEYNEFEDEYADEYDGGYGDDADGYHQEIDFGSESLL